MAILKLGFVPTYRYFGRIPDWAAQMRQQSLSAFAQLKDVDVIAPMPHPIDPNGVDANLGFIPDGAVAQFDHAVIIADYFIRQKVDGLIIGALDFGEERAAALVAEKLNVPVLLYATREPPVPAGPSLARVSDSYCGTLSIASALYRRKLPFHYAGIFSPDEPAFLAEIETFARAVNVVKAMRGARIGQVGLRPAAFETVGYDEVAMIQKFSQHVIHQEMFEIIQTANSYPAGDPAVTAARQSLKASAASVTVSDVYLEKAARLELALTDFWQKHHLSAMGMSCWPSIQAAYGISVCAIYGRLTEKGMLTACETDVLGALSMLVNYAAALQQTVPHFIDWTIQHRTDNNRFLAWHCGNAPSCLADRPERTGLRSRYDMVGQKVADAKDIQSGLYQFQIRPGKVTFCRLAEYDNQWKMLITTGEIVPSNETLAGTWAWVQLRDHQRLYRTLVEEGFIHHASMIHGDQTQALQQACKFLGIQTVLVE